MTFEEDVKNMKGRIREAIYEGKVISFYVDFHAFRMRRTGVKCSATYHFLSYSSVARFHVYFSQNMSFIKRGQLLNDLKKHIQENRGIFYDV